MIGERIKSLRENLGLSQEELAHSTGMHKNTIARWERDELQPRGTSLAKIARALRTTSTYLLGETDDPSMPRNVLSVDGESSGTEPTGKRLIIKNRDMYVDLPESSEGFEILRRLFDMQAMKNVELSHAVVQP